ncbi:MAG: hypothetical protein Q4D04_10545 [Clostridia bacterium]|nr:hypothetical protein [Clostridia bacterium]
MRNHFLIIIMILCLSCAGARAATLGGYAAFSDAALIYSGMDEDGNPGIYRIDGQNGDIRELYADNGYILGAVGECVAACVDIDGEISVIILDANATVLYTGEIDEFAAVEGEDSFYIGTDRLKIENGAVERTRILTTADSGAVKPVAEYEDCLYYLDASEYADISAMETVESVASLCRADISTGETRRITPEGATLVGFEGDRIIYTLNEFYVYAGDDVEMIDNGRGLYAADLNGENAVLLAGTGSYEDGFYDEYTMVRDGVIYGVRHDYLSDEPVPDMCIKRVTYQGVALEDIPVDFGSLIDVRDGRAYMFVARYNERWENIYDDITAVDLSDFSAESLLGSEYMRLNYYDEGPRVAVNADSVCFTGVARDGESLCLWTLARGGVPEALARLN